MAEQPVTSTTTVAALIGLVTGLGATALRWFTVKRVIKKEEGQESVGMATLHSQAVQDLFTRYREMADEAEMRAGQMEKEIVELRTELLAQSARHKLEISESEARHKVELAALDARYTLQNEKLGGKE